MLRIVIDTNVLVSAVIQPGSVPDALLRRWQAQAFEFVTCIQALSEFDTVLQRPHIAEKYAITNEKRQEFLALLYERVRLVPGTSVTDAVPEDANDNMFVACAVEGSAKYIVSGDKHLLKLGQYQTVRILTPVYFLKVFNRCQKLFS